MIMATALGCWRGEPQRDDTVLRLWKATHGETSQDWQRLLEPFQASHPNLRIQVISHPWEGWDERYTAAFSGGNPPDVAYMPDEFWPRYAATGHLLRLDERFPEAIDTMRTQYAPNLWQLGAYRGQRYAIPYVFVAYQVVFNKDLFDAADVPYPPSSQDDPAFESWTWERFAEVAATLTRDTDGDGAIDQWGYAWSISSPNPNVLYPFLWQGGADVLNPEATASGFRETGLAGLEYLNSLVRAGVIPEGGFHPTVADLFYEGRAAMTTSGPTILAVLRSDFPKLNVGVALTARGPASDFYGGRGSFGNSGFWVIAAASQHPRQALELIQFVNRLDNMDRMMRIVQLYGARRDWTVAADDSLQQVFMRARQYLVPYPLHTRLRQIHSVIMPEVQAMLLGDKTPREAVSDAADLVDDLAAGS